MLLYITFIIPPKTHQQNFITVHNFLSNVVHKQTDGEQIHLEKSILPKTLEALGQPRPPWPKQLITPKLLLIL